MAAPLRPNKRLAKLLYELMDAPKEEQQNDNSKPSKTTQEAWKAEEFQIRR